MTCRGGSEPVAKPVLPGVAFGLLLCVGVGVAVALGVVWVGVGVADGVAAAPATTLKRGVDGKPEPREE